MTENHFVSSSVVRKWILENLDAESIEQKLKSEGFGDETIAAYLNEFVKQKIRQKQSNGFIVTGTGAVLGFISCVLTLTNPVPELFHVILYGLTSVALLLIMLGLYLIFEWLRKLQINFGLTTLDYINAVLWRRQLNSKSLIFWLINRFAIGTFLRLLTQ